MGNSRKGGASLYGQEIGLIISHTLKKPKIQLNFLLNKLEQVKQVTEFIVLKNLLFSRDRIMIMKWLQQLGLRRGL